MIVGTAGTTNGGMIDPLEACARLAKDANLWFHVDAAWGGALIASEQLGGLLSGIEQAHSITIDAHKASRVFQIDQGAGVGLNGLTIENGSAGDSVGGAGILNNGRLLVRDSTQAVRQSALVQPRPRHESVRRRPR